MRQIDRNLKGVQKAWKLGPAAVRDERAPECSKQQKLTGIVTIYNWLYTYIYISLSRSHYKTSFLLSIFWRIYRTGAQCTCLWARFSLLIEGTMRISKVPWNHELSRVILALCMTMLVGSCSDWVFDFWSQVSPIEAWDTNRAANLVMISLIFIFLLV